MSMALCLADGGGTKAADTTEAGRILQRAYDLAAQNKLVNIQKEVAMLQVCACACVCVCVCACCVCKANVSVQ
jgi:hypothetical protein